MRTLAIGSLRPPSFINDSVVRQIEISDVNRRLVTS
jgi:hypothetical protein